jgi:hypothetical protein
MDPDLVLAQARSAVEEYDPETPPGDDVDNDATRETIVEAFIHLDEWLAKGGFLPKAWEGPRLP